MGSIKAYTSFSNTLYQLLPLLAGYSPKLTAALKNRGLATLGFQKKFHTHQLKPTKAKGTFQKVNLPPCKTRDAFPRSPLGYRVLATHLATPSYQPSPATKPAKFTLTRKWAGPVMPKGQFSRVPWPGSCRRLFTSWLFFGHFSSPTNIPAHST